MSSIERHFGLHRHEIDLAPQAADVVDDGAIGGNDFGAVDFPGEKFCRRGMFLHRSFGKVPQAIDIVCANGDGGEAYLQIVEHVFSPRVGRSE